VEFFQQVAPRDQNSVRLFGFLWGEDGVRMGIRIDFPQQIAAPQDKIFWQGEARHLLIQQVLQRPELPAGLQPLKAGVRVPAGHQVHGQPGRVHV